MVEAQQRHQPAWCRGSTGRQARGTHEFLWSKSQNSKGVPRPGWGVRVWQKLGWWTRFSFLVTCALATPSPRRHNAVSREGASR
ncbi:hypothetical protein E2C01_055903 [Portunus trituberculatus]|uniref:Uncharacterized protein n=1 Tax=Portunus trituberculatus TaxID=210409 RepID=A0A5B7GXE1_PORTR|nr:hypothetical protein [Portunus trituberculatus]